MTSLSALRIGIVSYTNALPLSYYLPEILPGARFVREVPSRLARWLEAGEIDVALLSSIELLRHPEYGYVPGIGICSDGPVRSVCLFTQKEIADLRTVALDQSSLSSVTLLRILMEEHWQHRPRYVSFRPPLARGLAVADAAVTIGDVTLAETDTGARRIDLGSVWKDWARLPFVYAVWITRAGLDPEEIRKPFEQAKAQGLLRLEPIVHRSTEWVARPADYFREYFTQNVQYDVGEREREGMRLFFAHAQSRLPKASPPVLKPFC